MAIEERKIYKKFSRPMDLEARQLEETESHINRIWKTLESMHSGNELKFQSINNSMMVMAAASGGGSTLPSWPTMAENLYPWMDGHNDSRYLRLDCLNDPISGPLEIIRSSDVLSAGGSKPFYVGYDYETTSYPILSLWDDDTTWFRLGFWKPASDFPPSMAAYRQFIIRTDRTHANDFVLAVQEGEVDTGRINFYNTSTYISSAGEFHAAGGVFNQFVDIYDDDATSLVVVSGIDYNTIELYYKDVSNFKYISINHDGFYIHLDTLESWWIGDSDEIAGFLIDGDGIGVYGDMTIYSEDPDTPPFTLTTNNTGVLVAGLNADLLDGLDSTDFAASDHDHSGVYEPALGNPAADGYLLTSTAAGVRSWNSQATLLGSGTNNYIPKFLVGATPTFTNSTLVDDGSTVSGTLPYSETVNDAATNTTTTLLTLGHNTSGTAAASFGTRMLWNLESTTTADQNAAALDVVWTTATHATRTSKVEIWNCYNGTLTPFLHQTGTNNLFLGHRCGNTSVSGSNNFGFGIRALVQLSSGLSNTAIGTDALFNVTTGKYNTAVGQQALYTNNSTGNTAIGYNCASACTSDYNTVIGYSAMTTVSTGRTNTAVGAFAGTRTTGTGSVFLGCEAGYYETAGAKLFIDNANRSNEAGGRIKALIYGIFNAAPASQYLYVNGNFVPRIESADTNAIRNIVTIDHQTTGTPSAGLGTGLLFQIESSTTASQDAAQIAASWTDATHATRTSKITFATVTSAAALAVGAQLAGAVFSVDHIAELTGSHGVVFDNAVTCAGAFFPRQVTDAGPMTATNGTVGEIVFNTSDTKFYGCTVTGTPATWAALN